MLQSKISNKHNDEFSLSWWLLTIFISFIISSIIIFIMHLFWHKEISATTKQVTNIISHINPGKNNLIPTINKKMTILAMGLDSNGKNSDSFVNTRSDVMILAVLDPANNTINAISIPRDCRVYLADNKGIDKINAAHAYGGPELAVKTVEQTFGVTVDHYMVVDYAGIKELVKALGGIEVYVDKRLHYTDRTARLFIDLQPGKQVLGPEQAEQYLRFRHDPEADIGRIKRQQWFVKGVLQKLKEPSVVFKLPGLIDLVKKYTRSNMDPGTLMQVIGFAKDIDFNKIQVATIPGGPSSHSRVSYWIINVNKAQILIDRLIFGYNNNLTTENTDKPITLSILYDKENQASLNNFLTEIEQTNYKVICKTRSNDPHTKILAHSSRATVDQTNELRQKFTRLHNASLFVYPDESYCAPSDFTIVLGKDN